MTFKQTMRTTTRQRASRREHDSVRRAITVLAVALGAVACGSNVNDNATDNTRILPVLSMAPSMIADPGMPAADGVGKAPQEPTQANPTDPDTGSPIRARFARSNMNGTPYSTLTGITIARIASQHRYAVGIIRGTEALDLGNSVIVAGGAPGFPSSAFVIAYDRAGTPQWARSTTNGSGPSTFHAVAANVEGGAIAAGFVAGKRSSEFGQGVSVTGSNSSTTAIIVRYSASGNALWARAAVSRGGASVFSAVASDQAGNTYAVGTICGASVHDFGSGVTIQPSGARENWVLVKYDALGRALWARTVASGSTGISLATALALDGKGHVYVAGQLSGPQPFALGGGISVAAHLTSAPVIAKYDSEGNAQWASTVSTANAGEARFNAVAVDREGKHIYVGGYAIAREIYDFGHGVTVAGAAAGYARNALLVQYDQTGSARWARSTTSGGGSSEFAALGMDGTNRIVAVGYITGDGTHPIPYGFGSDITVTGASAYANALVATYDEVGRSRSASSVLAGPLMSSLSAVAVHGSSVLTVGSIQGTGVYDFGNGVTVSGSATTANLLLVDYGY